MRLWNIVVATVTMASATVSVASAQEKFKLEYGLSPGMEITYRLEGTNTTTKDGASAPAYDTTDTGSETFVVTEDDPRVQLVVAHLRKMVEKPTSSPEKIKTDRIYNETKVDRGYFDRSGYRIRICDRAEAAREPIWWVGREVNQFYCETMAGFPLPAGEVAVGDSWSDMVRGNIAGLPRDPMKVASTLTEVKTIQGRRCAVIKSTLTSVPLVGLRWHKEEKHPQGEGEMVFDLERGLPLRSNLRFVVPFGGNVVWAEPEHKAVEREEITIARTTDLTLQSVRKVPPEELQGYVGLLQALHEAEASNDRGKCEAILLKECNAVDLPATWREGVTLTLKHLKERWILYRDIDEAFKEAQNRPR